MKFKVCYEARNIFTDKETAREEEIEAFSKFNAAATVQFILGDSWILDIKSVEVINEQDGLC